MVPRSTDCSFAHRRCAGMIGPLMTNPSERANVARRALLLGAYVDAEDRSETESLLDELEELVATLGIPVVDRQLVHHRETHARFLIGSGKAEEMVALARKHGADLIVIDNELSPSQ